MPPLVHRNEQAAFVHEELLMGPDHTRQSVARSDVLQVLLHSLNTLQHTSDCHGR